MVRSFLIFASLWAVSAASAFAQEAAFEAYHDSAGEVVRLSSQESEPFLKNGKKIEPPHPLAEKYANSLKRFPDVRSCLLKAERSKPQPDLTLIDWNILSGVEDADICVFRIASSYSTMEEMHEWFKTQGFKSKMFISDEARIGISASFSFSNNWPRIGSNFLAKAWIKFVAHGLSIGVSYKENKVFSVGCTYNIL